VMGLLAPVKGRRWLRALRTAAKAWGIIQECRALRTGKVSGHFGHVMEESCERNSDSGDQPGGLPVAASAPGAGDD
jgi:hypothetical protein